MTISDLPRKVKMENAKGRVIDQVSVLREFKEEGYDNCFQIQQIIWQDGSESIRFAYYKKPHGSDKSEWMFTNRPPNIEHNTLQELFIKAKKKNWFKNIL